MDAGAHLCIDRLCQRQSIGEERPLGVDDDEVIDQAKLVLRLGEAEVILGCPDRLTQIPNFIGERVQVGQGVFDIGIGDENLIYVRGNGLPVAGLGGFEIGAEPAALKDRERNARGNRCDGAAITNVAGGYAVVSSNPNPCRGCKESILSKPPKAAGAVWRAFLIRTDAYSPQRDAQPFPSGRRSGTVSSNLGTRAEAR